MRYTAERCNERKDVEDSLFAPGRRPYSSWSSIRPSCINTRLSGYIYTAKIDVLSVVNVLMVITYLSTLVPGFTDELKYAVVSGAVAPVAV